MTELRGTVVGVDDVETIDTQYGERDLATIQVRTDETVDPTTVSLWGDWADTAAWLEPGMTVRVLDPEERTYQGDTEFTTASDTFVIVEPDYLVNVTDIRQWIQCPRLHYLNRLQGLPLAYPVVKGTIVHDVFGDLLRGRDLDAAIENAVAEAAVELGLLDRDAAAVKADVHDHATAIQGWLNQGTLTDDDEWRSEYTLLSERYGLKGRCDAIRRGMPVELKTGKNTNRSPRFEDKVQTACYALLLRERDMGPADTGTLLYTKNAALDRADATGDLSPAKEFSIGDGLLKYVVRARNELAALAAAETVPTGREADAVCEYCFEQDACMVVAGRLDQDSKAGQVGTPIPESHRAYFDRFYDLIEDERRVIHRAYTDLWRQSGDERAAADTALIDLEPLGRRQLEDGRWELRAAGHGAVSKIRAGDVVLASDGHPVDGHAELARVERLGEEVVVTTDEPVELRRLDVYPSEFGADRMLTALHEFVLKGDERRKARLIDGVSPTFASVNDRAEPYIPNNAAQNRAVERSVAAEDFALIHGPPGTGKTYTIARLIRALVEQGERVLLSAFTNRAVDNAIEALREQGFADVVRIGTESGVRVDMQDLRLPDRGDPESLAEQLRTASVVAATTSSCGSRRLRTQSFDTAIIDEASQLTEPETLAAINRADRFVLVGDHHQLPPVVRAENDLSQSLFERLIDTHDEAAVMLDRQYRMAQAIQAFPSREFYDGQLRPATHDVAAQHVGDLPELDPDRLPDELVGPVTFIDPDGSQDGHTNPAEVDRIAEIVDRYLDAGLAMDAIGIIAPYRAQVAALEDRLPSGVTVDTVDRFQGSSKEVIVVSFVATGSLDGPLFEDYRRINVALTRAKKALVLVGDEPALGSRDRYARMLEWAVS
ncbi:MAG: AAA domain-containing protein [Halobacteriales archaeon]